jgi:hypothetical protein
MVLIENTYGNNTIKLRSHFSMVSESCGGVKKLGMDRFQALWRAFNPSIDELRQIVDILHSVWSSFIENVSLVAVDETLVSYQPFPKKQQAESLGEPIPVVYIPRKPHPNGLEAFLLASYVPIQRERMLYYLSSSTSILILLLVTVHFKMSFALSCNVGKFMPNLICWRQCF